MMFKQCTLEKNNIKQTAWIPEEFAHIGKILKIKEDNGWKVLSVGSQRLTQDYVSEREQDYKNQRLASDKFTKNGGMKIK